MAIKLTFKKVDIDSLKEGDLFFNASVDPETYEQQLTQQPGMSLFLRGTGEIPFGKYSKVWLVKITRSRK